MTRRAQPRQVFWMTALGLLALDQASKFWILQHFFPGQGSTVVPGFFNLIFITNDGMAFGLFQGNNFALGLVALLLLAAGILYGRTLDWNRLETNLCAAAVVAGAAGNLLDRLRHGYVVDFADFHWGYHHWPAFNVADSCITLAVAWVVGRSLLGGKIDQASNRN